MYTCLSIYINLCTHNVHITQASRMTLVSNRHTLAAFTQREWSKTRGWKKKMKSTNQKNQTKQAKRANESILHTLRIAYTTSSSSHSFNMAQKIIWIFGIQLVADKLSVQTHTLHGVRFSGVVVRKSRAFNRNRVGPHSIYTRTITKTKPKHTKKKRNHVIHSIVIELYRY